MSLIQKANQCFQNKNYEEAYRLYIQAKREYGFDFLDLNMEMCRQKTGNSKLLSTNIVITKLNDNNKVVDIILPIYNALEDVKNCINSLYEHNTYSFNLIAIDDCSDTETKEYLEKEAKQKGFKLLRNKENLRFTKTVNRGFKESKGDYVVLLNSDTIVTPRWIEKILACFESDEQIGIVGPVSNAARWQTVSNETTVKNMAKLVEDQSDIVYPSVPSVNGFCYIIKKELISKIGLFDDEKFPNGYGEEDDFSIRAIDAGYKIAVADDTYIYHAKSKSYTYEQRQKLSIEARKILEQKYGRQRLEAIEKKWNEVLVLKELSKKITISIIEMRKETPLQKKSLTNKVKSLIKKEPIRDSLIANKSYQGKFEKYNNNQFVGWIVQREDPSSIFEISIYIDNVLFMRIKNNQRRGDLLRHKKSTGKGGYQFSLPLKILSEAKTIILKDPSNKIFSEINTDTLSLPTFTNVNDVVRIPKQNNTSIIVPIYNAAEDLEVCIERLLKYTQKHIDIILIDDASPDPRIKQILAATKDVKNIRVYENEQNLGFTKTVNKGIKLAKDNDVVLLNSDARVTPRWLEGLLLAASSDAKVATVTPMSDRAGAFSAPTIGNENDLPLGVKEVDYAVAFRRNSMGLYPVVPTGNGFCMFIKRACINDIGALDEEAFPKGYGEENDFCMRARSKGWSNIIDDRSYVFHDRSKSFGDQKTELMKSGRAVVDKRYPDYKKAISVFSNSSDIALARFNASQALLESQEKEILPRVLYVISSLTGGTPQTNLDLMMALYDVLDPWLLYCDSKTISLYEVQKDSSNKLIRQHTLKEEVSPLTHISAEYDRVLSNWLHEYDFEIVHIRHLARQSLSLPRLSKESGAKVVYSMHDFYTLCPTIKLLDGDNNYCGGTCTTGGKECKPELWPSDAFPSLKDSWVHHWRDKFASAVEYCDAYVTTSQSAKDTLTEGLKELDKDNFYVIPHGRNFSFEKVTIKSSKTHHILIPGNINIAKGLNLIKGLLQIDKEKKLHFHILGNISMKDLDGFSSPRLSIHGKYKREDFVKHVKKINPTVGAVLSIWDETWCHTLTELWAVGLPVIALDYGTIKKRVEESGAGWIYEYSSIKKLYKNILDDLDNEKGLQSRKDAVYTWQKNKASLHTTMFMASSYWQVYMSLNNSNQLKEKIAVVSPSDLSSTKVPGTTYIRMWENTVNRVDRLFTYVKMTPEQMIIAVEEGLIQKAIIQRNVLSENEWKIIKELVENKQLKYIFDMDDDLLNVPQDKDQDSKYKNYRPILKEIISKAKILTVSTKVMQKKYDSLNKNIALAPNRLSTRLWKSNIHKHYDKNLFKAVYIGSYSHMEDLMMILPALENIASKYNNFRLKLIGISKKNHYDFPDWVEIIDIPDNAKAYPEFVKFIMSNTSDVHIGIAPLKDTQFNNNKSALKILEYAGLSLPVIASSGIVYDDLGKQAPNVLLVNNTVNGWEKAIEKKIKSVNHLGEDGKKMREWVMKNYCINETEFDNSIRGLLNE